MLSFRCCVVLDCRYLCGFSKPEMIRVVWSRRRRRRLSEVLFSAYLLQKLNRYSDTLPCLWDKQPLLALFLQFIVHSSMDCLNRFRRQKPLLVGKLAVVGMQIALGGKTSVLETTLWFMQRKTILFTNGPRGEGAMAPPGPPWIRQWWWNLA